MRRDLTIKSGNLAGTSDFRVIAPIKKGFVPSLDAVTYKTRVKRVLRTLHLGRTVAFENELARVLSDAVQRVGKIHSVGIAVLEPQDEVLLTRGIAIPQDQVLLTVTFDGAWEAYVRVIWQKVSRLLDLIFCNTEGYVLGYENTYEKWGAWLKQAQTEALFLYATPDLTVDDTRYLSMQERVHRREGGDDADLRVTRIRIPTAEDIAEQSIFRKGDDTGVDPTNAGFSQSLTIDVAGRPPFRHGVRSLVGLYRLGDVYPPGTPDGTILHRAAHELLPEFVRMLLYEGNTYQLGVSRALSRFEEAMHWIQDVPDMPDVRLASPVPLPDEPPLQDRDNVQVGIVSGYPDGADHGCLLLLQFASPAGVANFLQALRVTSEADSIQPGEIATNIAFTVQGLRVAGFTDDEIRAFPEEFVQGMELRAGLLGDVRVNHPRRWRLPAQNWKEGVNARDLPEGDPTPRIDMSAVHAILQLRMHAAGPDAAVTARAQMMSAMKDLVEAHGDVKPLSLQWMQRWRNPAGQVQEHFGFLDGDAQPVLRKTEAGIRFSNQVHLGEVLCGYPNLADKTDPFSSTPEPVRSLLQDGSFLVVRKLRQDIEAFESALRDATAASAAGGQPLQREDLMAKMMGRWPGGHTKAGQPLAQVLGPNPNDFHFDKDPQGTLCPFHAHIRRAHPRITFPDAGSRPARIMRRGMSYGPRYDGGAGDVQDSDSLHDERGLIFMAYNANIGEQFEVVQRWLNGGNSSGSYSGQSDPFLGFAESGRRRYFRFENEQQVVRMALDGSDRLHDDPRPFVRLEWGAYLFTPSKKALTALQARASAQGSKRQVVWRAEEGERAIERLQEIEAREGELAGIAAWKRVLEDPDAAADFTSASIWAAIREHHGGVLRTPYGILVGDRSLVEKVFADPDRNLTITGYLPRMRRSFGVLYLGLDPDQEDQAYERGSEACNRAIMGLDLSATFERARQSTHQALQKLVEEAKRYATEDNEARWELTLDARELIEPLLADFCEEWFGLSEDGACFRRAGHRWDWKPGDPPNYPGHFLSPSRYIFQPHPGPEVEKIGAAHGAAVRSAMMAFLGLFGATIKAPVARAVLDLDPGKTDMAFAARTVAGAMMGFIPTVDGNLRRILNEWLREGVLWSLRGRYAGSPAADFTEACNRLGGDFIPAMLLRAVPELIWRTATVAHSFGEGPHQIAVNPGEVIVAGAVSATQQTLAEGGTYLYHAFGGNRRVQGHPTHACPGADPALALMLGFFSALVESELPLRAGPGPLTLSLDGRLPPSPAVAHSDLLFAFHDIAFPIAPAAVTPIVVIGDSWLSLLNFLGIKFASLLSQLAPLGYAPGPKMTFSQSGWQLKDMASADKLQDVKSYLGGLGPQDPQPKALLIGGGGNDVTHPSGDPPKTRLFKLLVPLPAPGAQYLVESEVRQLIDVELFGYYKTIIDGIKDLTSIPILIHGYDHPIPDGRSFFPFSPAWLQPVFKARGYDFTNAADTALARDIMRQLIDRLNLMIANVCAAYPGRVRHINLTGILAAKYGAPENYKHGWDNELHASPDGFDALAAAVAASLRS